MCAAPRGNKFWKLRSKHGRDTLFATPELLWEAVCEYLAWCDRNPWRKKEALRSGDNAGKLISSPVQRPYTLSGLCLYLGCNQAYFRQFKQHCSKDFSTVITRIEETIETQQFEGAVVGAFNANIIARKLGLVEKTDNESRVTLQSELEGMSNEELKNIIGDELGSVDE